MLFSVKETVSEVTVMEEAGKAEPVEEESAQPSIDARKA